MASSPENIALVNELARRLNDNTRRIRVLEEKVRNFELQISSHDQRIIDANKEANSVSLTVDSEMSKVKERLVSMEVDSEAIRNELKKMVFKSDLKEMQDYIELISPITSKYATRGEVEEIVRQEIKRLLARRP